MKMKVIHKLSCLYRHSGKGRKVFFILGFLYMCLILGGLTLLTAVTMEHVRIFQEECGTFALWLDGYDEEKVERVQHIHPVDRVYPAEVYELTEADQDGRTVSLEVFYEKEERLDLFGIKLIKGTFPKQGEVLVDSEYAEMKFGTDDLIGKTITVPLPEEKEMIVSGVIETPEVVVPGVYSAMVVFSENPVPNRSYATFYDMRFYNTDLDNIQNTLNETVNCNIDTYLFGGYNERSLYDDLMRSWKYFYLLLMAAVSVITYNLVRIAVNNAYERMAIVRILGVRAGRNIVSFFLSLLWEMLKGALTGVLSSTLAVCVFYYALYHDFGYLRLHFYQFPYGLCISSILISLGVLLLIVAPTLLKIGLLPPLDLLRKNKPKLLKKKRPKVLFKNCRVRFPSVKIVRNNIQNHRISAAVAAFGMAVAVTLLIAMRFWLSLRAPAVFDNSKYDYSITMWGSEDSEYYENRLGFSDEADIVWGIMSGAEMGVPKKMLKQNYKDYLAEFLDLEKEIMALNQETVPLYVDVIAVNEADWGRLAQMNGISDPYPGLYEGYLFASIYSTNGCDTMFQYEQKECFDAELTVHSYTQKQKMKVKGTLKELLFYPETMDYTPILIVSTETVADFFEISDYTNAFVTVGESEEDRSHVKSLQRDDEIRVSEPKALREKVRELNSILDIMFTLLAFAAELTAAIIIHSSLSLQLNMNRKEYAMMIAVGVSKKRLSLIFRMEAAVQFGIGIAVGSVIAVFVSKYLFLALYPETGDFLFRIPWLYMLFGAVSVIILGILSTIPTIRKLYRLEPAQELWNP